MRKVKGGVKVLKLEFAPMEMEVIENDALQLRIAHAFTDTTMAVFTYNPAIPLYIYDVNRDARIELLLMNELTNGSKLKFISSEGKVFGTAKKIWCPKWITPDRTHCLIKKRRHVCIGFLRTCLSTNEKMD